MRTKIKNRIKRYINKCIIEYLNNELCEMIRNEFKEVNITFNHYEKLEYTEILVDNKRILVYKWSNILYNLLNFDGYVKVITKSMNYKGV